MKMSHEFDVPKSSLWLILKEEFEFRKILGNKEHYFYSEDQKIWWSNICHDNLISLRRHPNLLYKTLAIGEI